MKPAALISVSDRTGLVEFASALSSLGLTLLTTSGSGKALSEAGISHLGIDEYTGQEEILDGRVKTLHPKIHAGLLARRELPQHMQELTNNKIMPIDVVAVNLYPFLEKVRSDAASDPQKMFEYIDIGGPTMIRAAAKNHQSVLPVINPADYPAVIEFLRKGAVNGLNAEQFRRYLASQVFTAIAQYDLEIAKYMARLASTADAASSMVSPLEGTILVKEQELRYGENPHQKGAFYRPYGSGPRKWRQLQGKELSYNNLLDIDAALRLISACPKSSPATIIVKHANPCGAAIAANALQSLQRAKLCDPRSHFGGIIAFNTIVSQEMAENIRGDFAEVVVAETFTAEALGILAGSKNLRVLEINASALPESEIRSALDGYLIQDRDHTSSILDTLEVVSSRKPSAQEVHELQFAWNICAQVKSNAIVIVKDGLLIGVGAGQMSRIDSVELAISKARSHGHSLQGAVAASDAFFPFTDGLETLAKAGIIAIVAPSGAKKDPEVIQAANAHGVTLIFTPDRHFRH
jgi:phosphoribosylaminoimidazolecarboxamide formyltransferase/IMP cyclohydrolase